MVRGERFNGLTHFSGALLALSGAVVLIVIGSLKADPWKIVSFSIYGATLFFLYLSSTLYHSTRGRTKDVFRKFDHSAIYLLIAGTYTPFALVTLNGPWGWSLFGVVWGLAALGVVQEIWLAKGARVFSLVLYLLMGWFAVVAVVPLIDALTWSGFAWVAAGGAGYTAGVVFYLFDERVRHFHGIWHLFVLAGSAIHYAAILLYVA
jgi:hemolysin III